MIEVNNRTRSRIDVDLVIKTAEIFMRQYKCADLDLSVAFVGQNTMRRLNRDYRGRDQNTDILSFPDRESLGEIIMDPKRIKKQAEMNSRSIEEELVFILVHGLYHLLGFKDDTRAQREKMIKMGEEFMNKHHLL